MLGIDLEAITEAIWVLAHHLPIYTLLTELILPLFNTVSSLLFLKTTQYLLVFICDFDQIAASLVTIQTPLTRTISRAASLLHDVGHLLQEDSVLPLDLSVALFHQCFFLAISEV